MQLKKLVFLHLLFTLLFYSKLFAIDPPVVKNPKEGKFLNNWIVLGPMPLYEEDSVRRDVVEKFLSRHIFTDTIVTYPIMVGYSQYEWQKIKADKDIVKLSDFYNSTDQNYAYALCIVECRDSMRTRIGFASDDDAMIWHNGQMIHQVCKGRHIADDSDIIPVTLDPGRNTFLVRVDNRSGSWGFKFRFIDKETERQARKKRQFDPYKKYAPIALAKDAAILQSYLLDLHPGYSRYTSKAVMDAQFYSLQKELASGDSLSMKAFLRKTLPVLARMKDGNTMLWPDEKYFWNDYRYVPFEMRYTGQKLMLTKLFDYKLYSFQMSEVLSINGLKADDFILQAQRIIPHDGNTQSGIASVIADYSYLNLLCNLLVMDDAELELVVRTKHDSIDTLHLYDFSSCNAKYVAPDAKAEEEPINYLINDSLNYCKLTINTFNSFWIEKKGINFEKAVKNLFKKLDEEQIPNLVIDLRSNRGGHPELASYLAGFFVPEEIPYFGNIELKQTFLQERYLESPAVKEVGGKTGYLKYFKKAWVHKMIFDKQGDMFVVKQDLLGHLLEIDTEKYNYSGNVIVLINGSTSDVAAEFCSLLKKYSIAQFVGEETGTAQIGSCGGFYFPVRLPATSCRMWIPAIRLDINTGEHEIGRGIIPDVPVKRSLSDIQNRVDVEMKAAEKLIAR